MIPTWRQTLKPTCSHHVGQLCLACMQQWLLACKAVDQFKRESVRGLGRAIQPDTEAMRQEVDRWAHNQPRR